MNLFNTAKKIMMASAIALGFILAQRVVLYSGALFNLSNLGKWRCARLPRLFNSYYARNRVVNRVIHHRKYTPLPIYPNGFNSAAREM